MSLPVISITDHVLTEYTHNIVVRFTSGNHHVDYCTYLEDPKSVDVAIVEARLDRTLCLLNQLPTLYTYDSIRWTDDI